MPAAAAATTRAGRPCSTAAAAAVRQAIAKLLGSRPVAATNIPALGTRSASSRCAVQPPTASRVALGRHTCHVTAHSSDLRHTTIGLAGMSMGLRVSCLAVLVCTCC